MAEQDKQPAAVPESAPSGPPLAPEVTYGGYLALGKILDAQQPLAPLDLGAGVYAAEHFFIVVHQAFELWFKQELLDLGCACEALTQSDPDPELALDHLQRVAAIQRLLTQQMVLFDHLSPRSFLAFRPYLGAASGSESKQYREVERALGLRGSGGHSPIFEAFTEALARADLTLEQVYQQPSRAGVLYRLAELLVDISEGFWLLTAAHVRIAERTIGQKPGRPARLGWSTWRERWSRRRSRRSRDVRTRL